MKNLIVEGARGLGKSSITRYLRDKTTNSTLINFTGFNETGDEGKAKVTNYYKEWTKFFRILREGDYTFIHDRYFFSEVVYSEYYKDYSFIEEYLHILDSIPQTYGQFDLIILWTDDKFELQRNLTRDKAELFGREEESVKASLMQQLGYLKLASDLRQMKIPNVRVHTINVAGKAIEVIGDEILSLTNTK